MSNTFKPGDRIVYVGKYQYYHNPSNLGRAGTVVKAPAISFISDSVSIWFDGKKDEYIVYDQNIALEDDDDDDDTHTDAPALRSMVLGDIIDWADSRPETWRAQAYKYLREIRDFKRDGIPRGPGFATWANSPRTMALIQRCVKAERAHQELAFDYQLLSQASLRHHQHAEDLQRDLDLQEKRLSDALTGVHTSWANERAEWQAKIAELNEKIKVTWNRG